MQGSKYESIKWINEKKMNSSPTEQLDKGNLKNEIEKCILGQFFSAPEEKGGKG